MIIDLSYVRIDAGINDTVFHMLIQRKEQDQTVSNPANTQDLDKNVPIALMWEHGGINDQDTEIGSTFGARVFADTKGMRKLRKGDTIAWSHIATVDASIKVAGVITLFFKE